MPVEPAQAQTPSTTPPPPAEQPAATPAATTPPPETPAPSAMSAAADAPEEPKADEPKGDEPKADDKPLELVAPEGFAVDAKAVEAYKAQVKELGLSNEAAQKLFDTFANAQAASVQAQEAEAEALDKKWQAEIQADADIGGANWKASLQHLGRALKHFGGKPLVEVINQAGLGNNPTLVKAFVRVGRALGEDSVAGASSPPTSPNSEDVLLKQMYPTMFKE